MLPRARLDQWLLGTVSWAATIALVACFDDCPESIHNKEMAGRYDAIRDHSQGLDTAGCLQAEPYNIEARILLYLGTVSKNGKVGIRR